MIAPKEKYPFFYETHLHTNAGSACGRAAPGEMARACKAAGYTGIFVTEHNWYGNTCIPRSLPWEEFVERFAAGFKQAKAVGDEIGLDVFFGWEAGYHGTEFLIYGLDKQWLLSHPEIRDASVEEQFAIVHEGGGIVIHAHPYREEAYIPEIRLYPNYVDGVEGINAMHSNPDSRAHYDPLYDDRAVAYAGRHGLPMTAGSDIHFKTLLGGGMAFSRRLKDEKDFVRAFLNREDYILTNGVKWYDKTGTPMD